MKIGDRISLCLLDRKEHTVGDLILYLAKHIDPKFAVRRYQRRTKTDIPLVEQISLGKFLMICDALAAAEIRGDLTSSRKKDELWTYDILVQATDYGMNKVLDPMRSKQGNMIIGEISRLLHTGAIKVDLDFTKMGENENAH